jgi:hypothetical protein
MKFVLLDQMNKLKNLRYFNQARNRNSKVNNEVILKQIELQNETLLA